MGPENTNPSDLARSLKEALEFDRKQPQEHIRNAQDDSLGIDEGVTEDVFIDESGQTVETGEIDDIYAGLVPLDENTLEYDVNPIPPEPFVRFEEIRDPHVLGELVESQFYYGATEDLHDIFGPDALTLERYSQDEPRDYLTAVSVRPSTEENLIEVFSGIYSCNNTKFDTMTVDITNQIRRDLMMRAAKEISDLRENNPEMFENNPPQIKIRRIESPGRFDLTNIAAVFMALLNRYKALDNDVIAAVEDANEQHDLDMRAGITYYFRQGGGSVGVFAQRAMERLNRSLANAETVRKKLGHDNLELVANTNMTEIVNEYGLSGRPFSVHGAVE